MTAKDLRSLLYDAPDNSEVVILNENAPIKGAVPVYQTFTLKVDAGSKVVLMYQSILSGNAPKGKRLSDYAQGAESLKDVFNNEDIRRFDFAIFMRSTDVDPEKYNRSLPSFPRTMSDDALKNNVLFAWSRTPEQVVFLPDTVDAILETATKLSKVYGNATDIPLVSPSDQRNKVARLAVALASLTHSVDESGERITVYPAHVNFIYDYLVQLYNAPGCGLNYYARGNNNYGSDHGYPHEKCRPGTVGSDGRINLGLTGSGPNSWTHDGTPNGIYGLNGDALEWATGLRTNNGEIQILAGNNAAKNTADLTAGSAEWKAILPDGTLVAPGTAGTLKIDIVSGVPKISTTVKTTTSGDQWPSTPFKDLAVESGITIPDILKALAVFPSDNSDHGGDRLWTRNDGEKCFYRGGHWDHTSNAGVFCLYGYSPRSYSGGSIGFRPAYILL